MGLKSEGVTGTATLGTGSIEADFHCVGTTDELRDKFSMSASGAAKSVAPIRKNHDGVLSSPVAVGLMGARSLEHLPLSDVRKRSSVTSGTFRRRNCVAAVC